MPDYKITKCPVGYADGATVDGSICAASFGASGLGKAYSKRNYVKGKQEQEVQKVIRRSKLPNMATLKQQELAKKLGITLKKNETVAGAWKLIDKKVKARAKVRKEKKKARRLRNQEMVHGSA